MAANLHRNTSFQNSSASHPENIEEEGDGVTATPDELEVIESRVTSKVVRKLPSGGGRRGGPNHPNHRSTLVSQCSMGG